MLFKRVQSSLSVSSSIGPSLLRDKQTAKVWISLYTRDKQFSLSRDRICCLPAFDRSLGFEPSQDPGVAARLRLAHIQEKTYMRLYSETSTRCSSSRRSVRLLSLNQELCEWADSYSSIFTEHQDSTVDLHLAFRSTRVLVLRLSTDPHHQQQALQDSRIASRSLIKTKDAMGMLSSMPIHR